MALKRLLGTFAAIVLAAGLVAGCGKTGTAPKEAQAPSAEEESVDAEAEAAEEKGEDAAAAEARRTRCSQAGSFSGNGTYGSGWRQSDC